MKKVHRLATVLYFCSRIIGCLLLVTALYESIILLLFRNGVTGVPIEVSNDEFIIFLPFSHIPFLLGDYTTDYLLVTFITITLYAVFLWLLGTVFQVFRQQKIFIPKNVQRLKYFYRFNFFVPLIYLLFLLVMKQEYRDALIIAFLHLMISVFVFFIATIFQHGLVLQEEQDQTL